MPSHKTYRGRVKEKSGICKQVAPLLKIGVKEGEMVLGRDKVFLGKKHGE